eukprot:tig00000870_g5156.t1
MQARWARVGYLGPVHSVCVDRETGLVFSASGPYVRAHALATGDAVLEADALPGGRIHRVQFESDPSGGAGAHALILHGGRQLRLFRLAVGPAAAEAGGGRLCSTQLELAGVWSAPDWILESQLCPLSGRLVAALAHNELAAFQFDLTTAADVDGRPAALAPARVRSPPAVLAASAALREAARGRVECAFGTFFGDVLLWTADLDAGAPAGPPQRLSGARGKVAQVARVRWCEGGAALLSAGEDRAVRLWRRAPDGAWLPALAAFGHEGWVWDAVRLGPLVVSVGEDLTARAFDAATGRCAAGHRGRHVWCAAADEASGAVVTGGEDASVKVWDLREALEAARGVQEDGPAAAGPRPDGWREASVPLPHADEAKQGGGVFVKGMAVLGGGARCLAALSTGELLALYPLLRPHEPPRLEVAWRPEGGREGDGPPAPRPVSCMDAVTARGGGVEDSSDDEPEDDSEGGEWIEDRAVLGSPFGDLSFVRCLLPPNGDGGYRSWATSLPSGDSTVLDVYFPHPGLAISAEPRQGGLLRTWLVAGPPGGGPGPPAVLAGPTLRTADGHRVTSVAAMDRGPRGYLLFCGDRRGNMTVFRVPRAEASPGPLAPLQTLHRLHGTEAVARALVAAGGAQLWSVGHDGCLARASLRPDAEAPLRPTSSQRVSATVGNVPGGLWEAAGGDAVVGGFVAGELLFWNAGQGAPVGRAPLAGHKQPHAAAVLASGRRLVCLRAAGGRLHVARPSGVEGEEEESRAVPRSIGGPFHGREARAVVSLPLRLPGPGPGPGALLATGGEDTTVLLLRGDPGRGRGLAVAQSLHAHPCAVRCLAAAPLGPASALLFSGGGKECVVAWLVEAEGGQLRCERLALDAPAQAGTDQRVMALALLPPPPDSNPPAALALAACLSDGTLRLFDFDVPPRALRRRPGAPPRGHSGALLSACALRAAGRGLLFTGGTDGRLCLWAFDDPEPCTPPAPGAASSLHAGLRRRRRRARPGAGAEGACGEEEEEAAAPLVQWPGQHRLGVNCLAAAVCAEGGLLAVASGGDDQSVVVRWLLFPPGEAAGTPQEAAFVRLESAHASAVRGIAAFPVPRSRDVWLVTCGWDQRARAWRASFANGQVQALGGCLLEVADVSGMDARLVEGGTGACGPGGEESAPDTELLVECHFAGVGLQRSLLRIPYP